MKIVYKILVYAGVIYDTILLWDFVLWAFTQRRFVRGGFCPGGILLIQNQDQYLESDEICFLSYYLLFLISKESKQTRLETKKAS